MWRAAFCKPGSSAFLWENSRQASWRPPAISPCFPFLGVVATLFTLIESVWVALAFLNVLAGGERLAWCFCILKAYSMSGSVSVRAITFLTPQTAWANLSPLDTPIYIPCSVAHWMSMPASLKTSAASWESSCEWALYELSLWVGWGVNSNTVLWLETSIDFGDECLLRPVVQWVYKRLGTLHWCTHYLLFHWV